MSELIVRCSSIGKLMAKPENADLDPAHLTEEVRGIIAKTKRTEEEKSVLEEVRRKSLSAGGKSHVRALVRESVYGYEPAELNTKPILKGRAVEEECIALLARLTGRPLVKNTERRTNGLISGECDIFDAPLRHGRDVKAPFSMESMPIALADCYDSDYEWQMQGYEILWSADTWSVDYLLVDTPEELIPVYEPQALHFVSHIAEHHRWTSWLVKRDPKAESLIVDKVLAARRYYREVLNEFDRSHGGGAAAKAAAGIPPWAEAGSTQPEVSTRTPATPKQPAAAIEEPQF